MPHYSDFACDAGDEWMHKINIDSKDLDSFKKLGGQVPRQNTLSLRLNKLWDVFTHSTESYSE